MKTKLVIISASLTVLAALAVAGLAFAQGGNPFRPDRPAFPFGMMGGYAGGYGMHQRMMGGYPGSPAGYGPMHEYMLPAFADAFNLDPEDVQDRLDAGETMWDIARSQGFSDEEISLRMQEAHEQALQQSVEAGVITQEQAVWMDAHMDSMWQGGSVPGACHRWSGGSSPNTN